MQRPRYALVAQLDRVLDYEYNESSPQLLARALPDRSYEDVFIIAWIGVNRSGQNADVAAHALTGGDTRKNGQTI